MMPNIGLIDRTLRALISAGILSLVFLGPQTAWGYIGLISLLTAVSGFCPLYKIIGIKTCAYHPPEKR